MTTKRTAKKGTKKTTRAKPKRRVAKKPVKRAADAAKSKKRTPKAKAEVRVSDEPKMPRLPKRGLRDIGFLSFGKKAIRKKPRTPAAGAGELELAANTADRRQVSDTHESPHRKICDLLITASGGSLHSGTGWFIAPRLVVTAGHCVAVFRPHTPAHGIVRKILVMPARDGETHPSNSFVGWVEVGRENLRVHERWLQNGDIDFDFGAIILPPDKPLGNKVGFFGFRDFPDESLNGATASLAGYPDNVPEGTQWLETNPIREVTPRRLSYDIFTIGGQSGSPLFFGNSQGQIACGIHNFGHLNNSPFNSGVRINASVIAQLNTWIAESQ